MIIPQYFKTKVLNRTLPQWGVISWSKLIKQFPNYYQPFRKSSNKLLDLPRFNLN